MDDFQVLFKFPTEEKKTVGRLAKNYSWALGTSSTKIRDTEFQPV